MITTRRLSVLCLALKTALGTAPSAGGPTEIAKRHLTNVQGEALVAWEKARSTAVAVDGNSNRRTLHRELQMFADMCPDLDNALEQSGFVCECMTSSLTCQLPFTCWGDVCFTHDMRMTFSTSALDSINVCIRFTSDPTGEYHDICFQMSFGPDMQTIESCSIQVEDSKAGTLASCTTCDPCDGSGRMLNVDCSNIIPGTTTDGCVSTDVNTAQGHEQFFESVNSNGSGGGTGEAAEARDASSTARPASGWRWVVLAWLSSSKARPNSP
jgi:hypothetical protein